MALFTTFLLVFIGGNDALSSDWGNAPDDTHNINMAKKVQKNEYDI